MVDKTGSGAPVFLPFPFLPAGGPEELAKLIAKKPPGGNLETQQPPGSPPGGKAGDEPQGPPTLSSPSGGGDTGSVLTKFRATQAGGFNMTDLFVELLEVGKTLKTAARVDREAKLDQVESEAKAAAADIRASAALSLTATVISSGMAIVGGAVALKGATASQKAFETKFEEVIKPDNSNVVQAGEAAKQAAQLASAPFQFRSTLAAEGGKIAGGFFQFGAQMVDASKTEHQAQAAREQAKADNEGDYKQAAEKLIASVLDKLSEMQRLQAQTMSNIAHMG